MNVEPDTTNISDLPVIPTHQTSNEESIQNMSLSTEAIQQDNETVIERELQEKRVRFSENMVSNDEHPSNAIIPEKTYDWVLTLEHKIILLATFAFFVFMDPKFKKYILNILVQVFGSFLKTETGLMSKLGMFVYALFYGLLLLTCVSFIDFTSFHLAF